MVQGFSFSPKSLTVALGDTVVFTGGNNSHTVTGDGAEPFCGPGLFTSCSVTFSTLGSFPYHCIPHAGLNMTGVVQVVEASATSPLTIVIHGQGTVSPDLNGQALIVGNSYTITAAPAAGFAFSGWTGGLTASEARLTFTMQPNLVLEANFVVNPLESASGNYNGLFYVEDGVQHETSGAFTFRLIASGKYTGKLQLAGKRLPFSGQFGLDGKATNAVPRPGTNALSMELTLDSEQVHGEVSDPVAGWEAELMGDRAPVYTGTSTSPYAGNYTLLVTKEDESDEAGLAASEPDLEIGTGFGTLKVDAKGKAAFRVTLADGTAVAQTVPISKAGLWPLYVSLYGGKGSILSWVSLSTNPAPEASLYGELNWSKPAQTAAKYYPDGFNAEMDIVGSIYHAPGTNRVLEIDMGIVSFEGGNLTEELENMVTLGANNKVTNLTTNRPLTLKIAVPTGLFSGTLKTDDGGVKKTLTFKGAILQRQNLGAGFFLGTDESGSVHLENSGSP
jgi:hypothetical protein